jgi:hypothetical protein
MVGKLLRKLSALSVVCLAAAALVGCGAIPVTPMPNALPNLTAERLGEIQADERLTDDEKRQLIRDEAQIPNDASGDRLVEFLLTLDTTP